jgi:hypothetical protein
MIAVQTVQHNYTRAEVAVSGVYTKIYTLVVLSNYTAPYYTSDKQLY